MPNIRATMFMDCDEYGWSETLVKVVASPDALIPDATALRDARKEVLASNCNLTHIRLSDADIFRDARLVSTPAGSQSGKGLDQCSEPWDCGLARLESSTLYRKNIYVRGIPDSATDPTGQRKRFEVAYHGAFLKYLKFLVDNQWGFLVRKKEPLVVGAPAYGKVTGVDGITDPSKVVVTTQNPHFMVDGDSVLIRGVKGPRAANGGPHLIRKLAANTFELLGVTDTRFYDGGGLWRKYELAVAIADKASFVRVSHRDTGRPSSSPRGRRLTRRP